MLGTLFRERSARSGVQIFLRGGGSGRVFEELCVPKRSVRRAATRGSISRAAATVSAPTGARARSEGRRVQGSEGRRVGGSEGRRVGGTEGRRIGGSEGRRVTIQGRHGDQIPESGRLSKGMKEI